MRRLGIVVFGILLLAFTGCIPGLDDMIGPIDDGESGSSRILVEYQVCTVAVSAEAGDMPWTVSASIGSLRTITYDPDLHVVSCGAATGDLLVQMWIYLNPGEDMIDYIKIRRVNSHLFADWMRYDFIESYSMASADIELVRMEGNDKVFRAGQHTLVSTDSVTRSRRLNGVSGGRTFRSTRRSKYLPGGSKIHSQ